ncbi:hypothetical protein CLAFUW4_07776 [Fulvia fulva]|uniref:DUF7730 domain-containing protein n=1 Tax=Passalora fulva TaxID=5499 RepID=A0A9Q8P744_PASFU|nr:uncharacterized protein CLAFUR5_07901 [Fulvia fulva]KAK4629099.1 hypothetical protein CLAFUR4_07781 [Fulvia fulva]KAK4630669.1 hypothetical protein CLAFUR0_07779 [Fulvia fulva]UJO15673.1 hypothetical protein CLAFUR5_07901 [Fulvia fulva]WPV12485.1 hypothetical protein CLAFUW4_07776 [Fulvia fulva]WPV27759.1 hypothetical protein CLAFUW7_07777 [Fulvia fulva]
MYTHSNILSYHDRLQSFNPYWDAYEPTARQLAAIGHICDRPPVEALENGSHCGSCNRFVRREDSVKALQDSIFKTAPDFAALGGFRLHNADCIRLQFKLPDEVLTGVLGGGYRMSDLRHMWERKSQLGRTEGINDAAPQSSSLFSLPTEIRLEIYAMVLPTMDKTTPIVPLNKDSARIVTKIGYDKTGPRDTTKIHILSTCHAVYEEALDILYTNTTYSFDSTKLLYLFLRHTGHHGRRLLKSVDVLCGHREDAIAFALLASCPKLKAITIRLGRPVLLYPGSPLWVVDGVACLLELSGLEMVEFAYDGAFGQRMFMDERQADAAVIRRELMRPRGQQSGVRWVGGHLYG